MEAADRNRMQRMPTTAQTVLLNSMIEKQRYAAMLHAPVPTPPREPAKAAPGEAETALRG
jgi:hypothetical protein